MRVVFLGTPDFALAPLRAMAESGRHRVIAAVTQPDRPAGRSGKPQPPPVKVFAEQKGIPVLQYAKIRAEGAADLAALAPDIMVTCAFGQILSREILDIPRLGVFNIHASLLPKYRGAAPVQWAIVNGEKETGVTIMQTDEGVDTGDIVLQKKIPIGEDEGAERLFERLSNLGAEAILEALDAAERGEARRICQDEGAATRVGMLRKESGRIDWNAPAEKVYNLVRGLNPWPGTYTTLGGETLKILSARRTDGGADGARPGQVIRSDPKGGLIVACGEGALEISALQIAGGKRLSAADFLRGRPIARGRVLGDD